MPSPDALRVTGPRSPQLESMAPSCPCEAGQVAHPLTKPADQEHHPLIHDVSTQTSGVFPTWRSWLQKAGCRNEVDCNRGIRIDDSAAALQTAISGNGIALGRTTLVEHDLEEGRLARPFQESQSCELAYYLVHKKEGENSAPVVAFKERLISEAGAR